MFFIDLVRNSVAVAKAFTEGFCEGWKEDVYLKKMTENLKAHTGTINEDYARLMNERNRKWSKRHRDQKF